MFAEGELIKAKDDDGSDQIGQNSCNSQSHHCFIIFVIIIIIIIISISPLLCVTPRRYVISFDMFARSFALHEISPSNILRTVWPRITIFYVDIHTDIVYSRTGYDVIISFRSEVTVKKRSKLPPPTASGGISQEWFKLRSRNFTHLLMTIGLTNLPDTTPLTSPSRLRNAIKYCTKLRKTGKESINWTTV